MRGASTRAAEEAAKEAIDAARRAGGGESRRRRIRSRRRRRRRDGETQRSRDGFQTRASRWTRRIDRDATDLAVHAAELARGDPPRRAGEGKGVGVGGGRGSRRTPGFPSRRSRTPCRLRSGTLSPGWGTQPSFPSRTPRRRCPSRFPWRPGSPRSRGRHPHARCRDARTPVLARGRSARRDGTGGGCRDGGARGETQSAAAMAQAKMAAAMAAKHADDAAAGESARPALAPPPDERLARVGSPAPRGIVVVRVVRGRGRVRRRRTQRGVGSVDARDQTSQGWRGRGARVGLSRDFRARGTRRGSS